MTINRLLVLQGFLLAGLGAVFLIPNVPAEQPVGITLELPSFIGEWYGVDQSVTEKEREILGEGTEFARKAYTNGLGDELFVSIVLSGEDMNTSIHRPERCLPAQGWTVSDSTSLEIPIGGQHRLPVTRLHNWRQVETAEGDSLRIFNLNYYWFVGHRDVTASHFKRTLIDVQNRLMQGQNQRWAYITVAAVISKDFNRFGRDETQTDAVVQEFVKQLVPAVHLTAPGAESGI